MNGKLTKTLVLALGAIVAFGGGASQVGLAAADTVTIGSDRNTGGPTESDRKTMQDILKDAKDLRK